MSIRGALLTLGAGLALLAASCGGSEEPIRIGLLADCEGFVAPFHDVTLAGAELPLLRRGAELVGSAPVGGVEGFSVGGHEIELSFGCATETTKGTLEARRLVELEKVDLVIGPNVRPTGAVLAQYARSHPEATFLIANGEMLGHLEPGPNVFQFGSTYAQTTAGLGAYAFNELGWRRAVTISGADPYYWGNTAGFIAEFCALGGEIGERVWLDTLPENVPAKLAGVATEGVDGFFLATDAYSTGVFLTGYATEEPELARKVLAAADALVLEPAVAAGLRDSVVGIVTASNLPYVSDNVLCW